MNTLLDNSLVGGAILLSAIYAVAKLGPRDLRKRMLAALSRALAAAPPFPGLRRVQQNLANAAAGKAQGACGGCDNCGTESSSEPQPSSGEIRIPVANIGRKGK